VASGFSFESLAVVWWKAEAGAFKPVAAGHFRPKPEAGSRREAPSCLRTFDERHIEVRLNRCLLLTPSVSHRPLHQEADMTRQFRSTLAPLLGLAAALVATPAFAGPPLLCHPYDIGTARSLPWSGANSWSQGDPAYRIENLVADTEALLTPSTPVVVRMETLRRAAIYASTDGAVAARLLDRFVKRAETPGANGQPDALQLLDAAYIAGAYREMTLLGRDSEWAPRMAGVRAALGNTKDTALIGRSIAARPDDPGIRFAAALILADSDRQAYREHAEKARAGAAQDALLARNINHVS
jgi:hypothetical protein